MLKIIRDEGRLLPFFVCDTCGEKISGELPLRGGIVVADGDGNIVGTYCKGPCDHRDSRYGWHEATHFAAWLFSNTCIGLDRKKVWRDADNCGDLS